MRLGRLELLAFGHFKGNVLDFAARREQEPGAVVPGFDLVYGDNEAGKSTALRAIRALMYGVPIQTTDAFLHAHADLRLAGDWIAEDGSHLYLVRRKGKKNTLLDAAGNPVDEAVWQRRLGGADETLFAAMFGLNHDTLRHGAQSLLAGEGKAGESLFGASMGSPAVRRVLAELVKKADDLYTPKSRSKRINQELLELKRIKANVQEESVSPSAFRDQEQALLEERARGTRLLATRKALRTEQAQIEHHLRLLPLVAQRAQYLAERAQLGVIADLPHDSEQRRLRAERARHEAEQNLRHEQAEIERVTARLARLDFDRDLLHIDSESLDGLNLGLGQHRKAQIDLPKREGELKLLQADADRLLLQLGNPVSFDRVHELRITDNDQARLKRLAKEKTQFETKLVDASGKLKKAESALQLRRKELEHEPEVPDVEPLALAIARAGRLVGVDETAQTQRQRLLELEQRAASLRARMTGFEGAWQDVARLPVPGFEAIARFEQAQVVLQREQDEAVHLQGRAQEQLIDTERALEELEGEHEVPTEAQLRQLRSERDRTLEQALSSPEPTTNDRARESVRGADAYADRMFAEVHRVTRRAALVAERTAARERLRLSAERREQLATERAAQAADWQRLWAACRVEPASPREMIEWLRYYAEVVQIAAEREALLKQVQDAETQVAASFDELSSQLGAIGESPRQLWEQRLAQLAMRAEAARVQLSSRRQKRLDLQRGLDVEVHRAEELQHELQELKETERVWRGEWQKALKSIGLEKDAGPDEVLSVLERSNELFHKLKEMEVMQGRILGMRRDSERLDATVKRLLPASLGRYRERPLEEACEALIREARRARANAEESERLASEIEQRRARAGLAETEIARAESELQRLMALAKVTDLDALARAEEAAQRARNLAELIVQTEAKILALGEGATLELLIERTKDSVAQALKERSLELEPELEACDVALDQSRAQAARLEQHLESLRTGASTAAEELAAATATLRCSVREYMRLRLAHTLLNDEVERYRAAHQGPVLGRAEELFRRLTLDAYSGLKIDFDAKDQQILLCVGNDGRLVETQRLSDGTRDQLYLALRLASLKGYLEQQPPIPLVLDDILIHFDDARARAALLVLAEFAREVQVLFFTHHRRVRELAERSLPPELLRVHELGQRPLGAMPEREVSVHVQ